MRKTFRTVSCSAILLIAVAGVRVTGADLSVGVASGLGSSVKISINGTAVNGGNSIYAGTLNASFVNGSSYGGYGASFQTYCTDVSAWLASGSFNPLSIAQADALSAQRYPAWRSGGITDASRLYNAFASTVNSAALGTALQLAIWNALYEADGTLLSGNFKVTSAADTTVVGLADGFLGALANSQAAADGVWWEPVDAAGSARANQGLIGPPGRSVPAPAGFGLASLVALAFGCMFRRRS
jgi:hypothetical protein